MTVSQWLRRWPWVVAGLALGLLGAAAVLAILSRDLPPVEAGETWEGRLAYALLLMPAPVVGALIASRRAESWYGWVWLALGLGGGLNEFGSGYAASSLAGLDLPAPAYVAMLTGPGFVLMFLSVPFLMFLFPNGHLPSPRWRHLARITLALGVIALVAGLFIPGEMGTAAGVENPIGMDGPVGQVLGDVVDLAIVIVFAMAIPAAVSVVVRYRSASGVERQQIKWFAFAASLLVVMLASDWVWEFEGLVEALKESIPIALMPIAIGMAILRHRLYDIDRIVSRTVSYGLVTAVLLGGYAGAVFLFRAILPTQSDVAVVASTLAVAAAFNPLRRRIQRRVDRRFNRSRYDAERIVDAFTLRLRSESGVDDLRGELVDVAFVTMQPSTASLWLRGGKS